MCGAAEYNTTVSGFLLSEKMPNLSDKTMLSIVIPLYNEEESIGQLHREISEVADANNYDVEMIFVDDGSTDGSWALIEKMSAADPRIRAVRFRRNFGKAAALQAGFHEAKGDFVLTMDADLQDDPQEIPDFLRLIDSGFDVVSGWKQRRHDPWHKVYPSRIFNGAVSRLTGVKLHDHNCGMKCYRREVLNEVDLYGERHRFIPVLAAARGYKVGEKVVQHRARQFGHSKYGFARFAKGFLDLISIWFVTRYGQRPQHFLGTLGLLMIAWGMINFLLQFSYVWYTSFSVPPNPDNVLSQSYPVLVFVSTVLAYSSATIPVFCGITFIGLGFLAELTVAKEAKPERNYSVKKKI